MSLTNGKILKDDTVDIEKKLKESIYTTDMSYGKSLVNVDALTDAIADIPPPPPPPIIPGVDNVGTGAEVYKGLNSTTNDHEFRGITTKVVQPTPTDNQITGNITAKAEVIGDNIELEVNFSQLKVPLSKTDGIPEYYVHSAGDDDTADGSIVRPYKTWGACKAAIIGTGTFWNPLVKDARVIFQTSMSTTESLTLNRVTYRFDNNSSITYLGDDYAVIDMQTIINAVPKNPNQTATTRGVISIEGFGTLTRSNSDDSKVVIIRASGYSVAGESNPNNFYIRFTSGTITINEKAYDSSKFKPSEGYLDGAGREVYLLRKSGSTDDIPPVAGLIHTSGRNRQVRDCLYIDNGATVNINTSIQRAIYCESESGFIVYGNILIQSKQGINVAGGGHYALRYGRDLKLPTQDPDYLPPMPTPPDGTRNFNRRYTPSTDVSLITIKGASGLNVSSTGSISSYVLGSFNEGGYNSFVELENSSSSFQVTGKSNLSISVFIRFNHLMFFRGAGTNRIFQIESIFTNNNPYISSIGSNINIVSSATDRNRTLIGEGRMEGSSTKLFDTNVGPENVTFNAMSIISGRVTSPSLLIATDNDDAVSKGLIKGMFYRTGSDLKIVY